MARSYARLQCAVWSDPDFTALTSTAQRLYLLLISQPGLTFCGVLPYTPRRWARLSTDTTVDQIDQAAHELADARFVLIDDETEELAIRSFLKHDIGTSPNLLIRARRDLDEVESPTLRAALAAAMPLADAPDAGPGTPEGTLPPNPSATPSGKGSPTSSGTASSRSSNPASTSSQQQRAGAHATPGTLPDDDLPACLPPVIDEALALILDARRRADAAKIRNLDRWQARTAPALRAEHAPAMLVLLGDQPDATALDLALEAGFTRNQLGVNGHAYFTATGEGPAPDAGERMRAARTQVGQ